MSVEPMSLDMSRYVELFLAEGREHVAQLTGALARLGGHGSDHSTALTEAFRAAHSLKGMAAAMGYAALTEGAHALETQLAELREPGSTVSASALDQLLRGADLLAREIELAVEVVAPGVAATSGQPADGRGGAGPERDGAPRPASRRSAGAAYVRVRSNRLDVLLDLVGELEIARGQLARELGSGMNEDLAGAFSHTSRLLSDLKDAVLTARMVPVGHAFDRLSPLVRETARSVGKEIDFDIVGGDVELDRSVVDEIGDPVMHLLRNAIDHGIETAEQRVARCKPARGRVVLAAERDLGHVRITVSDDGAGIDRERVLARAPAPGLHGGGVGLADSDLLAVLTTPGFSTAERVTTISGRGVGLDAVDSAVRGLGGSLGLESAAGRGTTWTLRLPLSVMIVPSVLARVGGDLFAVPFTHVEETVELESPADDTGRPEPPAGAVEPLPATPVILLRRSFGLQAGRGGRMKGITVAARGRRATLVVDELAGHQDIVVKQLDRPRGTTTHFAGATVLSDGSPALIVDVNSLLEENRHDH